MKKVFAIIAIVAGIGLVFAITFQTQQARGLQSASVSIMAPVMPDSVMKIFKKSCMDCHSNDGSGMAKGKVNFDKWETYTPEKQASKAKDICEEVTKVSMPPKGFRKNNPDLVPTEADIKTICAWAQTFQK